MPRNVLDPKYVEVAQGRYGTDLRRVRPELRPLIDAYYEAIYGRPKTVTRVEVLAGITNLVAWLVPEIDDGEMFALVENAAESDLPKLKQAAQLGEGEQTRADDVQALVKGVTQLVANFKDV